jgi:hypothetical protein
MITGQVTEQEYIVAHTLARRKLVSVINWGALMACLIGAVLVFTYSFKAGFLLLCAAVGGFLGEFIQSRFIIPARLRRLYAQVRGRVDLTYSWDDEKLFLSSSHGHAARAWTDFTKAKENDEVILLYFNDAFYEIIAKRWFANASDLAAFRTHLSFVR